MEEGNKRNEMREVHTSANAEITTHTHALPAETIGFILRCVMELVYSLIGYLVVILCVCVCMSMPCLSLSLSVSAGIGSCFLKLASYVDGWYSSRIPLNTNRARACR